MFCEQMLKDCAAAFAFEFHRAALFQCRRRDPTARSASVTFRKTHAIPLLLEAAAGGRAFTILATTIRPPTALVRDYVHDRSFDAHVRALRALLDGADGMALNLGTGRGWSVRELVATVREATGRDFPVQFGPRRPGDPPALIADPTRAREKLGWRPQHCELATQVSHAWAWRQGRGKTWQRMRDSKESGA